MKPEDFKELLKGFYEQDITEDQPHVSMRCEENEMSLEYIKSVLLGNSHELVRVVEDRPKVYKLYYRLSRKTELKIIIDFFIHNKINIRTIKRISDDYRLGSIKRRF